MKGAKVIGKLAKSDANWTVVGEFVSICCSSANSDPTWLLGAKFADLDREIQLTAEKVDMVLGLAWDCPAGRG